MKTWKYALALTLLMGSVYGDEIEVPAEAEASIEVSAELKELISAIKQDGAVNKERIKRLKKLIKERRSNQPAETGEESALIVQK